MGKALWCRAIRTLIFPAFCRYHRTRCKQAGQRVVILVDEYDKPMLQAIGNEKIAKQFRDTLNLSMGHSKQWMAI